MPNSVLLKSLFSLSAKLTLVVPFSSPAVTVVIAASLCGVFFALNAMRPWHKNLPNVAQIWGLFFSGAMFSVAFAPLLSPSCNMGVAVSPEDEKRLLIEALGLVVAFAAVCAAFLTQLSQGRNRTNMAAFAAWSCGLEVAMAAGLAAISVFKLLGAARSNIEDQMFFCFAALVAFKTVILLWAVVYSKAFAAKSLKSALKSLDPEEAQRASFKTVKMLASNQSALSQDAIFLALISFALVSLASCKGSSAEVLLRLFLSSLFAFPAIIVVTREIWRKLPSLHPLSRSISRLDNPDAAAFQLLQECSSPLFRLGNMIATPNFLVQETFDSTAFYLPDLALVEGGNTPGSGILVSKSGKKMPARHQILLKYARFKLEKSGNAPSAKRFDPALKRSLTQAIAYAVVLFLVLLVVALNKR